MTHHHKPIQFFWNFHIRSDDNEVDPKRVQSGNSDTCYCLRRSSYFLYRVTAIWFTKHLLFGAFTQNFLIRRTKVLSTGRKSQTSNSMRHHDVWRQIFLRDFVCFVEATFYTRFKTLRGRTRFGFAYRAARRWVCTWRPRVLFHARSGPSFVWSASGKYSPHYGGSRAVFTSAWASWSDTWSFGLAMLALWAEGTRFWGHLGEIRDWGMSFRAHNITSVMHFTTWFFEN